MITRIVYFTIAAVAFSCAPAMAQLPCQGQCVPPGCQQVLVSRHCNALKPGRIVIVVANNRQGRMSEQDLFAEALAKHLRKCSQFSLVVSSEHICQNKLPMRRGVFDEAELLELSRTYQADTVLYCELSQLTAFQPMRFQMSVLMVNVGEAVALVSASCTFDLRDAKTYKAFTAFAGDESKPITEAFQHSPATFIDYASTRVARTLLSVWKE